jgi:hypothetical protein
VPKLLVPQKMFGSCDVMFIPSSLKIMHFIEKLLMKDSDIHDMMSNIMFIY